MGLEVIVPTVFLSYQNAIQFLPRIMQVKDNKSPNH